MKYLITLSLVLLCCLPQLRAEISVSLADSVSCVCEGNPQQAFEVIATGSAGPFTFEWTGPEDYSSTAMVPTGIKAAGIYTLRVTNAYGCTFEYQVEAPACTGPTFQFDIDPPSDCGVDDGHINLTLTGGTAPFTYQWYVNGSHSVTSEDFEDAEEGQAYSVEVTDGNGCVHFAETPEVEQLPPLSLELSSVSGACPGLSNGAVEVVASGGAPPYQFQWSNGANTTVGELNGLLAGSYSVTVTDDDECNSTLSFVIEGASLPAISVLEQTPPSSKNSKFAVYPAPFSSFLQLEYQDLGFENSRKVHISLLNSLGMRVYSHSFQEVFEQGTLSITNLSHLPSGIYWLEVAIEGQPPQLFKCIKQ